MHKRQLRVYIYIHILYMSVCVCINCIYNITKDLDECTPLILRIFLRFSQFSQLWNKMLMSSFSFTLALSRVSSQAVNSDAKMSIYLKFRFFFFIDVDAQRRPMHLRLQLLFQVASTHSVVVVNRG